METRILSRLQRFWRDDSASASVEFVLVAPLFLGLVFSVFEAGWLMTQSMMLERGLDQTVREIRIGNAPHSDHAGFRAAICDRVKIIRDCEQTMLLEVTPISSAFDIPAGGAKCTDRTAPNPPSFLFDTGGRSNTMFVRACVIVDPLFPGMGVGLHMPKDPSGGFQMIAYSAFVNEPI